VTSAILDRAPALIIRVRDQGAGFDPETLAETDRTAIADLGGSAVVVWLADGSGAVTDRVAL